jgi:hypothetical protein
MILPILPDLSLVGPAHDGPARRAVIACLGNEDAPSAYLAHALTGERPSLHYRLAQRALAFHQQVRRVDLSAIDRLA